MFCLTFSCFICLRSFSSLKARFANTSDWKGLYSFLMATLVPVLESSAELQKGVNFIYFVQHSFNIRSAEKQHHLITWGVHGMRKQQLINMGTSQRDMRTGQKTSSNCVTEGFYLGAPAHYHLPVCTLMSPNVSKTRQSVMKSHSVIRAEQISSAHTLVIIDKGALKLRDAQKYLTGGLSLSAAEKFTYHNKEFNPPIPSSHSSRLLYESCQNGYPQSAASTSSYQEVKQRVFNEAQTLFLLCACNIACLFGQHHLFPDAFFVGSRRTPPPLPKCICLITKTLLLLHQSSLTTQFRTLRSPPGPGRGTGPVLPRCFCLCLAGKSQV